MAAVEEMGKERALDSLAKEGGSSSISETEKNRGGHPLYIRIETLFKRVVLEAEGKETGLAQGRGVVANE